MPTLLGTLVAVGLLGWAATAAGQVVLPPATPPPAAPPGPTIQGLDAAGEVTRLDRRARTIVLDSGVEYVLPEALDAAWVALREGAGVRLRYNVDGGRNIVSQIQITH